MPLTIIQTRVIEQIQALANESVSAKEAMTRLIGMYGNEFAVPPTTEQLQEYPEFAHMTQDEFTAAAGALVAINTVLGEFDDANSNVVKLLKICTQTH